jgi:orotidine-5'-phosphate decarboxylase
MTKKYKKVCVAFDTEQYAKAIEILDKISSIHRDY